MNAVTNKITGPCATPSCKRPGGVRVYNRWFSMAFQLLCWCCFHKRFIERFTRVIAEPPTKPQAPPLGPPTPPRPAGPTVPGSYRR